MKARRQERLAKAVKEEVGRVILQELKNPRIGFVTVVRAEVAPDVKTAKVFVSVMGDDDAQQRSLRELQMAKGFIQAQIAPRLGTRHTPVLTFKLDQSVKQSLRVSQLIKRALAEQEIPDKTDASGETSELPS